MMKKDIIYKLGEYAWFFGTLGTLGLVLWYVGLPAADYVDNLLFGPKPREQEGFLLVMAWLVVVPNVAVAPAVFVMWLNKKIFFKDDSPHE